MFKGIGILNRSTGISNNDVQKIASACSTQISRDVSPAWNKLAIPVKYYASENQVPSNYAILSMMDFSDVEGALGYHTETLNGRVIGKVFVKTIMGYGLKTLFDNGWLTVSSVVSHEVLEMIFNPFVDIWADGPEIEGGSEYAYEVCDPVEADCYTITATNSKVTVSNFVYPEWFDEYSPAGTKYDHMRVLNRPLSLSQYGYMVVRSAPGAETEVFGAKYPEVLKKIKGMK